MMMIRIVSRASRPAISVFRSARSAFVATPPVTPAPDGFSDRLGLIGAETPGLELACHRQGIECSIHHAGKVAPPASCFNTGCCRQTINQRSAPADRAFARVLSVAFPTVLAACLASRRRSSLAVRPVTGDQHTRPGPGAASSEVDGWTSRRFVVENRAAAGGMSVAFPAAGCCRRRHPGTGRMAESPILQGFAGKTLAAHAQEMTISDARNGFPQPVFAAS